MHLLPEHCGGLSPLIGACFRGGPAKDSREETHTRVTRPPSLLPSVALRHSRSCTPDHSSPPRPSSTPAPRRTLPLFCTGGRAGDAAEARPADGICWVPPIHGRRGQAPHLPLQAPHSATMNKRDAASDDERESVEEEEEEFRWGGGGVSSARVFERCRVAAQLCGVSRAARVLCGVSWQGQGRKLRVWTLSAGVPLWGRLGSR